VPTITGRFRLSRCAGVRRRLRFKPLLTQLSGFCGSYLFRGGIGRTMASLASRPAGIRNFDGLLLFAVELSGIVAASYLNPSFPLLLCFELWQYLRRLPQGNHCGPAAYGRRLPTKQTAITAGFPSGLHLLQATAFAVTLMLPAEGWAQAAPVSQSGATRPDATSNSYGAIFPRTNVKTVPNINTVETAGGVPSLSPRQKFPDAAPSGPLQDLWTGNRRVQHLTQFRAREGSQPQDHVQRVLKWKLLSGDCRPYWG
jgi:hypothetical protein